MSWTIQGPGIGHPLTFESIKQFEQWRDDQKALFSPISADSKFGAAALAESDARMVRLLEKLRQAPQHQPVKISPQEIGLHQELKGAEEVLAWMGRDVKLAAAIAYYLLHQQGMQITQPSAGTEAYILTCLARHVDAALQWQAILSNIEAVRTQIKTLDDDWNAANARQRDHTAEQHKTLKTAGQTVEQLKERITQFEGVLEQRNQAILTELDQREQRVTQAEGKLLEKFKREHDAGVAAVGAAVSEKQKELETISEGLALGFGKTAHEATSKLDKLVKDGIKSIEDARDATSTQAVESINSLRSAIEAQLTLGGPVQYWGTRADEFANARRKWARIFAGAVVVYIVFAIVVVVFLEDRYDEFLPPPYWTVGVLSVILLSGLWGVRTCAKLFWSNHHLCNDAKHRKVVGDSFVALLQRDVGLVPEERLIIFKTLFRPASDGIVKDDGYPSPAELITGAVAGRPRG